MSGSPGSGWIRIEGSELEELIAELNGQLRYPLPRGTAISQTRLSCYPRHDLLRLELPGTTGPRQSYAFHAPGQLYPLDWTAAALRAFDLAGLEVETPEQAEEAVRFHVWAVAKDERRPLLMGDRHYVVEGWDELPLADGAGVDDDVRSAAEEVLGPITELPPEEGDPPGAHRFRASVAGASRVRSAHFRVDGQGVEWTSRDDEEGVYLPLRSDPVTNDRYAVLLREVAFTAQRFLRHIAAGRALHQARVTEPVNARGRAFEAPVSLSQVTFQHDVDFGGATFKNGLELDRCVVDGRLVLRDAQVQGTLDARGIRFNHRPTPNEATWASPWQRTDLDAAGLKVTGSLLLEGLRSRHVVTLSYASVDGDLRLGGADIGPERTPTLEPQNWIALNLEVARVGGDLDLAHAPPDHARPPDLEARPVDGVIAGYSSCTTVVRGALAARRLQLGGEALLGGLRCEGYMDLRGATFQAGVDANPLSRDVRLVVLGDVYFNHADVQDSIVLGGAWFGGALSFVGTQVGSSIFVRTGLVGSDRVRPTTVRGELTLSALQCGDVELEGCRLGDVRMATGKVERLFLQAGLEEAPAGEGGRTRVRPCRVDSLWMSEVDVGKSIRLVGMQVGEPPEPGGSEPAGEGGFVRMFNVECGGDLNVSRSNELPMFTDPPGSPEEWAEGARPTPDDVRTRVQTDFTARGLDVSGGLSLVNLQAGGRIGIRNCEIGQDLDCGARSWTEGEREGRTFTDCRLLDLEMTRCGGDADLSGLRVTGDGSDSNVRARRLQVEGRLLFSAPRGEWEEVDGISQDPDERFDAEIEGRLDLSVAEAAHLVISGTSFQKQDATIGISLERGRFRRLHVIEPFPFRHDLSDTKVERWQIPTEHLLTFLDRSHPFRRSNYIEIERILRNEAQEAEADRVYRGMRRRAIREEVRARKERGGVPRDLLGYVVRTTGSRILGLVYGWGTLYWLPMLFVALPTFLLSWTLFSAPVNVEATPPAVMARGLTLRTGPVRPYALGTTWGAADGAWMAIRYHVPVVPLGVRSNWEPTDEKAWLVLPSGARRLPFSAEGYAFFIYLLHWIVWPLFLYGLGRKVLRDRA